MLAANMPLVRPMQSVHKLQDHCKTKSLRAVLDCSPDERVHGLGQHPVMHRQHVMVQVAVRICVW